MTSPARGSVARRSRRGPVQVVFGVVAFAAVAGSVVAVFTDDAKVLKLALVAVLWVAVGGLFFVEQLRRRADTAVARNADQRVVYELELEREVRARRENELAVEREVRERVSAEVRSEGRVELDELREELKALRENLSLLLSGDLLVERVALRAESTRLRSLTDTARLESGANGQLGGTQVGTDALEAETVEHATEPDVRSAPAVQQDQASQQDRAPLTAELEVIDDVEPVPEPVPEPVAVEPAPVPVPEPVAVEPAPVPVPEPVVAATTPERAPIAADEAATQVIPVVVEPVVPAPAPAHGHRRAFDAPSPAHAGSWGARAPGPTGAPTWDLAPLAATGAEPDEPAPDEPAPEEHAPEEPTPAEPAPAEADVGAHSAGRSVSDLIAAYGGSASGPRRRRRSED